VEDHTLVRAGLRALLSQEADIEIVGEAGNGLDAIKAVGQLSPHLMLTDLTMPGMNGEETLSHLRKLRPGLDVIISSGYAEAEVLPLFKDSRIAGFLQKPYTVQQLAGKVKTVLA